MTKLASGRYQVSIEAGWTQRGTRRRIRRTTKATGRPGEQEAKVLLKTLMREAVPEEGVRQGTTVKAWCDHWLTTTQDTHRPKTWATNRSAIRVWIVPTIGHKRLDKLTLSDVRSVTRAIRGAGRSDATAQRAHVLLVKILRDALIEGHSVAARLLEMEAPDRGESDRDAIPQADALTILSIAAGKREASMWVAALLQGMRPAEVRGLTWDCVDLEADLIDVSWQLQALPYTIPRDRSSGFRVPAGFTARHLVDGYHLTRPKTKAGRRIVPIVPWMHDALVRWQSIAPTNAHGLVWPGVFGRPMNEVDHREAWAALCSESGVGAYDLYEARHTTATLLLDAGIDMEVIKAIMGHASILSTKTYAHVQTTATRRALETLAGRLGLDPAAPVEGSAPEAG
jgi:integrase